MILHLTLQLPPTTNHAYATVRGRRVLSADGRAYKASMAQLARHAAAQHGWCYSAGQRLAVRLRLHFPDNRRCDIANREKLAVDALAEALGFDDAMIDELLLQRGACDKAHPRCEVELRAIGADQSTPQPDPPVVLQSEQPGDGERLARALLDAARAILERDQPAQPVVSSNQQEKAA